MSESFQNFVTARDGAGLNTFVYLPAGGVGPFPVILQRTPYGITKPQGEAIHDPSKGWLPDPAEPMRGSILRGWRAITERGYVAVYQDTRGRYGSEGMDRVYADDAADGHDTLKWIAAQPWCDGNIGMSGSSAGATTTFAGASAGHPALKAYFAQVGGASIYDDVVCEGGSIEMERLWLWVSKNIPGLSPSHRALTMEQAGIDAAALDAAAKGAAERYDRLEAARHEDPPYVNSPDWMRLPLTSYPDFSVWQPFLDEILTHSAPDDFRAAHDFSRTIEAPGFLATTWYDIFQTSMIRAFTEIQGRTGNQRLWIGPNHHYFIYETNFWPTDPYFDWFDHWLKGVGNGVMDGPPVRYAPDAWTDDPAGYVADNWRAAEQWPPGETESLRLYLCGDGTLDADGTRGEVRRYVYDPRNPVPTLGGRNMLIDAGPRDQRPVQALPHYGLTYRGAPLSEDLTIAGPVRVTLRASSDCPDTDFVAKLIEAHPDGRTMLLMDGVVRALYRNGTAEPLVPGEIAAFEIDLAHIHHTVRAGHCLQIDITSSNFPRRARNTNSGNPVLANDTEADIRVATNSVYHAADTPSFVTLPIVPR